MNRKLFVCLTVGATLVALACVPASAQNRSSPLSLKDCLRTALENNLDLVSARKDPEIAEQQIEQNLAGFDGSLSGGIKLDDFNGDSAISGNQVVFDPVTQQFVLVPFETAGENASEVYTGDVTFSHLLKYGGNYTVSYNLTDEDRSSTSIQAANNELQRSSNTGDSGGFSLTYRMPLLAGFGREVNTAPIVLARGSLDISKEDLRLQTMTTLQSVEDAYWDVVAAGEALRTFRLSLKRAEDLLELNKKKVEVGTLAPIEITAAEAGVAAQVEAVIVGETTLEDAEDVLLQLMAAPESDPMWVQSLELTDLPSFVPTDVDLDQAIETALERRPEMASAMQRLRNDELSERVSRKNRRHELELTAVVAPDQQDDDLRILQSIQGQTVLPPSDTNTDSEGTFWSLELRYTLPLRNRAAKADYAIKRLNHQKSEVAIQSTEQSIRVDVRRSARNLQSGVQRVQAARKNVELQQKKLNAEQKKFDNGMSTSFEVLTFQNDLADAELSEIRARLEYLKALTALERSKGTLLEARGLSLGE